METNYNNTDKMSTTKINMSTTPRRVVTRAAHQALLSYNDESESLTSNSPFRAINVLDRRFDKLSSQLTNTLTDTLTRIIKAEISQCEQRIITEMKAVIDNIGERVARLETTTITNEMLENKLLDIRQEMQVNICNINEHVTKLEAQTSEIVDDKLAELRTDINNVKVRVTDVESSNVKSNGVAVPDDIQNELSYLRAKILQQENSAVSCELRINGIPQYNNENTFKIFDALCEKLGIPTPDINQIYRVKNKNKNQSTAATILVKLMSPYDKNFILRAISTYRRSNNDLLRLSLLNFDSNAPFFVNENLSAANYKIFIEALKLKRLKSLFAVFTMRGIVHIKKNEEDKPTSIDHIDVLKLFFRDDQDEAGIHD